MHPKAKLGAVAAGGGWAAPSPVTLTATGGETSVLLTWSAAFGATGYDVQRSLTNSNFQTIASDQTTTSFEDSTGEEATLYYYRVLAKFRAVVSPPSNVATGAITPPP